MELNCKIVLFASRQDAGRQLGEFLRQRGISADEVLGLPRGGVVVAAGVARALQRPLDVLIVRKIGHPWQREFAVGALAEPDVVIFDESFKWKNPLARAELDDVIAEEKERLREYGSQFHRSAAPVLEDKMVLLVDDGLATGSTMRAAVAAGYYLGVDGPLTYKKNESLRGVFRAAPLERILIETDAPYLTPQARRGTRNEPAFVRFVAEKLAEVRSSALEQVAAATTGNAARVFRWELAS